MAIENLRAHVIALNEKRLRAVADLDGRLERIAREGQGMNAEDREYAARVHAEIKALDEERELFIAQETRANESAVIRQAHESQFGEKAVNASVKSEADALRSWMSGNGAREFGVNLNTAIAHREAVRSGAEGAELRSLLWDTGNSASLVPTQTASSLYQYLEAGIALLRMPTTKFPTPEGNAVKLPKVTAHEIGTQVISQGTAIGGTDPGFATMQLDAFKYGALLQISNETVQDTTVDLLNFVSSNLARAVARIVDTAFVTGSGSGAPNGIQTAIAGAGTKSTGGSLITPTYENLVDLRQSVNDQYRSGGNAAWLMNDLTVGNLMKLRDNSLAAGTSGQVMWVPSPTQGLANGQPDRLLGYPVYTDPNVASLASNAKIIYFGDWSTFYIRTVGDFVLERSDDYAFNTDLATFRGKWRVDSDLIDTTGSINVLKQSV